MARTRRTRARDLLDSPPPQNEIDRIVQATLRLLDEVGLDGLSMRNLAQRLDVQAATLYWYIRDKHELLSLLAEAIAAEIRPPDATAAWRVRLEALMGEYRRVLLAHRDAAHVFAATMPAGAHRLQLVDISLGAVLDAGFEGWDATRAGRLLVDYTTGFVQEEYVTAARLSATAARQNGDLDGSGRLISVTSISGDQYPHVAALSPFLLDADGDARFAFGLGVVLDGLEQQPQRRRRRQPGSRNRGHTPRLTTTDPEG